MNFNQYLVFATIAFVYIVSPGPAVFLSINYGARYGIKKTMMMLLGNSTGLAIIATISALGIGAIIVSSSMLLTITKLLGALVLGYLGIKMLLSAYKMFKKRHFINQSNVINHESNTHLNIKKDDFSFYKEGLFLALSNPKAIVFFTAIYPQFITDKDGVLSLFILGATFVMISFTCLNLYTLFGKTLLAKLLDNKGMITLNLLSGSVFMLMSGLMLIGDL